MYDMQTVTSVWEQMALNSHSLQQLNMAKNNIKQVCLGIPLRTIQSSTDSQKLVKVINLIYSDNQQQRLHKQNNK